jgi:hypothetical protein
MVKPWMEAARGTSFRSAPLRLSSSRISASAAREVFPLRALGPDESPQTGDVVLYQGHMSIYADDESIYSARRTGKTFDNFPSVSYFGNPTGYFRYQAPSGAASSTVGPPLNILPPIARP